MLTKDELPACPVATIVALVGNKWKLLIIRNLLGGTQRFNEMRRTIPGIRQKVLTDNHRELEHDELIVRKVYAEVPPRVDYELTALGRSLKPVLTAMRDWGLGYAQTRAMEPQPEAACLGEPVAQIAA